MNSPRRYWFRACLASDIPQRGSIRVKHGGIEIAIFKTINDELFALEDKCPHMGGPLSAGMVHGNCVTCPLHNWDISLESGQAQGADTGRTNRFEVKVEDEAVLLFVNMSVELAVV